MTFTPSVEQKRLSFDDALLAGIDHVPEIEIAGSVSGCTLLPHPSDRRDSIASNAQ
jgi:hypothetical protein